MNASSAVAACVNIGATSWPDAIITVASFVLAYFFVKLIMEAMA
jgi:hypothetical protein